jgi:hypothetical protein
MKSISKSKLCYDRWSVGQSVLVSSHIWGQWSNFCYCQTVAGFFSRGAPSLTRGRVCRLKLQVVLARAVIFTAVKISSTCHLCLQSCMPAISIVVKSLVPCGYLLFTVLYVTLAYMYVELYKTWHVISYPSSCNSCYNGHQKFKVVVKINWYCL